MPTPAAALPWAAPRSWAPLALTVGLHLLLVLAWIAGMRGEPTKDTPQRVFSLVLLQPPARPQPAAAPLPVPPPRTRQRASTAVQATTPPAPAASVDPEPEPVTAPQADPAPGPALPGDIVANSRAMAGRVDRDLRKDLRKGGGPITAEPERKWERFAEAFAEAQTSKSYTITLERYEAPDGVTIYRKTIAGRKSCYRSGSVGGLQTGFGVADGRGAGTTPCPSGVSWTQL